MQSFIQHNESLNEGGAFGHLSHPFDITHFTFSDMSDIIVNVLAGKLDYAEEKTDGHNLMLSFKDGQIIAARSKTHLKNNGANALDVAGMASKLQGRDNGDAYVQAMKDLYSAIMKLSSSQRETIFKEGGQWMSVEVMMPKSAENVIEYGVTELRLHGVVRHDLDGKVIAQIDKKAASMLDGMLRQVSAHQQEKFHIRKLSVVKLPQVSDFKKQKSKYLGMLSKYRKGYGAGTGDTIIDVRRAYFNKLIDGVDSKNEISTVIRNDIINRWSNVDKSIKIVSIKKSLPKHLVKSIAKEDKKLMEHIKNIVKPLEMIFLKLGADVLHMMSDLMTLNPDKAIVKIQKEIEKVSAAVLKSKDSKLINKLGVELERLEALGGSKSIIPTEGLTFFHKGELIKLTGTFAPVNQLLGLNFRL